jgi:hypothetical protein
MKKNLFTAITLLMAFCANVFCQTVGFNGRWKINIEKTDFGHAPASAIPDAYYITQHANQFIIIRSVKTTGPDHLDTLKLSTGGPAYQNFSATHKKQVSTLKQVDDHTLAIHISSFTDNGQPYLSFDEILTLDTSGTLNVVRSVQQLQSGGSYEIKGVFERKL